LKSQS